MAGEVKPVQDPKFIVTPGAVPPYELVRGLTVPIVTPSVMLKVPVIGEAGKVMGEVVSRLPTCTV